MKRETLRHYLRKKVGNASWAKKDSNCWITGRTDNLEAHHDGWSLSFIVANSLQELDLPCYKYRDQYTKEELAQIRIEFLRQHELYARKVILCHEVHTELHQTYGSQVSHKQLVEFKENYNKRSCCLMSQEQRIEELLEKAVELMDSIKEQVDRITKED